MPNLTPAELAALQKIDELRSIGFGNINGVPLYVLSDALRELAAERGKRAALVAEWRAAPWKGQYTEGLFDAADQLEQLATPQSSP